MSCVFLSHAHVILQDRDIKATVYRISGSIPSSNYIQLPKSSSQSLNLTGRYLYVQFRPQVSKYFVLHFEVVTDHGMVVRVSLSNLFKEFKSTSTWLQFPYVALSNDKENCDLESKSIGKSEQRDARLTSRVRWTLLVLDLKAILSHYLHANFAYLKNVKLCSNLLVKNVFTSEIEYSPFVDNGTRTPSSERIGSYAQPLPKEISFLVARGHSYADLYDYVRFPAESEERVRPVVSHAHLKGKHPVITNVVQESIRDDEDDQSDHRKMGSTKYNRPKGGTKGQSSGSGREASGALRNSGKKSNVERSRAKENLVHVSYIFTCAGYT